MSEDRYRKDKQLFQREIESEFVRDSKAFCIMPWVHLHVNPRGEVLPCCRVDYGKENSLGNINEKSLMDIWNGEPMRAFRRTMLRDQPDERCKKCYEQEKQGGMSLRQATNQLHQEKLDWVEATETDGFSRDAKPIYWDIRFSNLCNFRCRICSHTSSSAWYHDAKALKKIDENDEAVIYGVEDFEDLLSQLEQFVPFLEEIYFAGGEPLLMDEHYGILDLLESHGRYDVKLRYNTNFSKLAHKTRPIFHTWKKFDFVLVLASLDGSHERGELQRKGQLWSQVVDDRKTMLEICPEVHFMVAPTTSIFNALHLPDFHKEWTELKLIDVTEFWPSVLRFPEEYCVKVLPASMKKQVEERYLEHVDWIQTQETYDPSRKALLIEQFRSCVNFMNAEDQSHLLDEFQKRSGELDHLRSESTADVLPELRGMLGKRPAVKTAKLSS